jgi:hypothetical protein
MVKRQFAYVRPLFQGKSLTKQISNFVELGVDIKNIFCDEKCGEVREYKKMMSVIQQGDTLYIKSLRVLGTEIIQMIDEWNNLKENSKVNVNVLDTYMMDVGEDNDNIESEKLIKSILNFSLEGKMQLIQN